MILKLKNRVLLSNHTFPMSKTLLEDLEVYGFLLRYFDKPEEFLTCETEVICERNEICAALMKNESLTAAMQQLYDISAVLVQDVPSNEVEPIPIIRRMYSIKLFYSAAKKFIKTIEESHNIPNIFYEISELLSELLESSYPADFDRIWANYAKGVEKAHSISFQINFTESLEISSIAMTGVYKKKYTKKSFFNRISGASDSMCVDSLLTLVPGYHSEMSKLIDPSKETTQIQRFSVAVQKILFDQTAVVKGQLQTMERVIARKIRILTDALCFALGMVKCAQSLSLLSPHICFAQIRSMEERTLHVSKMIHPLLAEQVDVTPNNIAIDNQRDIILLGGINRGGKTTYLRTVGAVQVLFQMGLPIPAATASISPASGIFSVFSRVEITELNQGKLGRELVELRDAITMIDENSLFLGNEPISGTSPKEGYLLSRESLCILKAKCVRGIWVTHLFKLFDDADELNAMSFGSKFGCMHTEPTDIKCNYTILPGKPDKHSGAKEAFNSAAAK